MNHCNECMHRKAQMEAGMLSPANPLLKSELLPKELDKAVRKRKLKKARGFDKMPNEVLKRPDIREGLFILFSYCFESGLVPSNWLRGIVTPIPKGLDKDSSVTLNYRGISLLSSVQKVYSSIINTRLTHYLEATDIGRWADLWFSQKQGMYRSCIHMVCPLSATIRNRLETGKTHLPLLWILKKHLTGWIETFL